MKKTSLVLFPVLAALLVTGCTTTKKKSKKKSSSASITSNTGGGGSSSSSGGGGGGSSSSSSKPTSSSGGGGGGTGDTVNLYGQADKVSSSDAQAVYKSGSWTVTIDKGTSGQTVEQAISASKTFEMRVYQDMIMTFSGQSTFSKLVIVYSTYVQQGKTFYFDFEISGATVDLDNDKYAEKTQGEATVTLGSAVSELVVNASHQTRIATVTFVA